MPVRVLLSLSFLALSACQRADAVAPMQVSPALAAPAAKVAALDLDPLLSRQADGERPITPALIATLSEATPTAQFAWQAERGRCYRVVVLGTAAASVAVRDQRKKVLVEKSGTGELVLETCAASGAMTADVTGLDRVDLRVFAGAMTAVTVAPRSHGPAVVAASAPVEKDALAQRIADSARSAAPGSRRMGPIFRGRANDQKTDWTQHLDSGRCYTFIGAGADGVKQLGLYLWDPAGAKVTYQRAGSSNAVMYFCTKAPGPYHFQAKLNYGKGDYAVGLFVKG